MYFTQIVNKFLNVSNLKLILTPHTCNIKNIIIIF